MLLPGVIRRPDGSIGIPRPLYERMLSLAAAAGGVRSASMFGPTMGMYDSPLDCRCVYGFAAVAMADEPGAPQVPATGKYVDAWHRFAWNLAEGLVTAEELREEPIDDVEPGLGYNPTQMDTTIDRLQRQTQQPRVPLADVFAALRISPLDTDA